LHECRPPVVCDQVGESDTVVLSELQHG
jgi:hypothetical protein